MLSSAKPEKADPARHAYGKVNANTAVVSTPAHGMNVFTGNMINKLMPLLVLKTHYRIPWRIFRPQKMAKIAVQYASPPGGSFP